MEFANQVIMKVNNLKTFMISLSTRQRILTIICCLLIIHLCVLTFGLTLIFTCGTVLGAWCAWQLWKKPVLFQWDNVIPFLPHIAKQRPLFQSDSEEGKTQPTSNFSAQEQEALSENRQSILQTEMSEFVRLMMRDFVVGWYRILSDDDQFSHNVFLRFKDMIKNVKGRFVKIDQRVFLCTLLHELRAHVDIFRRLQMSRSRLASESSKLGRSAKQHSVVSIYETFAILHPALQSEEVEKEHLSQLSNSLIVALLPSDVIQCDTMVFLLQDILINNVLQPLVQLISNPDFVNEAFILLLMDEPLGQDHHSAYDKPSAKEELPRRTEIEPASKEEEAPRDHKDVSIGSHVMNHDVDTVIYTQSKEKVEKYKASAETEKMNSSVKQEVVCRNENQSQDEIKQKLDLDETESRKKTLPSPFEIIEPPQQFTFPMPMTMLEPSKAIPREDPETVSKEELKVQDETSEKVDLQPTVKVKGHRRSASSGSNIIANQTPVSQSSGSVIDSVIDSMAKDDYGQSSRIQGMRSCFSANCLTELGECASTCQKTESPLGVEFGSPYQSTSSLNSPDDLSSHAPFNFETDVPVQEQEDKDGQRINAEDDSKLQPCASQGSSPRHRYPLLRSETAPELIQTPPDYHAPHPSIGGDIPLEWAMWRVTNLNIPTTSWLGDPKGKRPVVYFIIKYDLLKKPTLSDDSEAAYSNKNEMEVRRRYREFVNLHARITNNPHLRRNMRGIANIPKQSMLPLSRPTPAMEEQKRLSLETYLKQLLSRPVIHNSREMAEFLAIDGDGHIEFVKKASNAPLRIDKLLIHQVSGIVGTIKTILPERPSMMRPSTQLTPSSAPAPALADQPNQTTQSHDQSRPMTEESQVKQQPIGGEDQWDLGGVVDTSRIRLFGLDETKESHMQRVMKLLITEKQHEFSQRMPSSSLKGDYEKVLLGPRSEGDGSDTPNEPHTEGEKVKAASEGSKGTVEVYQALFGVMSEALLNQQSFILDQDLQGTLTVLIGDLIDKWLFREVGLLFTEAQWGYYLSLLRELIWPGGVLNPKERDSKTPEEMAQTKAAALHELTHNAAAMILSVILGEDHLREGISLVLDSLQDQALNKHLLFTFLDHAMDQLVPEIHDAKFQESLAAMP